MYRDYYCGEPTENLVNKEITLSGWINKRRDHGGLLFIDLRDREPKLFKQIEYAGIIILE